MPEGPGDDHGPAHHGVQGDRAAASRAYSEAIVIGRASGNTIITILATIGLGNMQEAENRLHVQKALLELLIVGGGR